MFTQFCNSDAPSHLSEKLHVNPSRGVKSNVAMPPNFSNVRSFSLKKDVVVDDDYEVHGRNSYGKMMSATKSIELKSRQFGKNQEDNLKVSQSGHFPEEGSANPLANYRKMGSCSSTSLMVVNSSEPLKRAHLSSIQEVKCVSVNSLNRLGSGKLQLHQAHVALGNKMTLRDDNLGELTADGIHRLIGKKHFCEARSAIINQQRIFVVQVFELHRLIKVQRSIAASPHLLLDDNLLPGKPSLKVSELNKLPCGYAAEPPCLVVKPKDKSEKPTNAECPENNVVGKLPLPFLNKEMSQRGLCAPMPGFMAPVYGGCGPMSLNPGGRDFLTAAYGFPAHQGIGILPATPLGRHFPPCGLPVLHPSVSASAFEGISPFTEACSNGHDNRLSIRDINSTIPQQSSCNNSIQVSQAASAKENELPGSTVSSSSDKKREDILPLFPVEPAVHAPDQKALAVEHQTRVIKVLPHNPRSATKSACKNI
ncbi:Protein EARLY FLOWERING 3-like protein [Quillaja saponaria]|uniref:Protein EARLY FLOWERING 3-like protein n=1 Tax=Quillaja saponaria TaxID=32244 RepID=A0AAD7LU58_QUISA|nr:Protein EARLY FLOWERING 3-like protein [Quillaja saponaria]KAJ7963131.1 Protein EARLY FLOWERING 3-like protein [Quillaja saponaria]